MKKYLSLFIGLRYIRSKSSNFISFVSFVSIIGIALGVSILITVLSVMNGFAEEIHQKVFDLTPQLILVKNRANSSGNLNEIIKQYPEILATTEIVMGHGLLLLDQRFLPVAVSGIDPKTEIKVSKIKEKMREGKIESLMPASYHAVISETIARNFSLVLGDKITLLVPKIRVGPLGVMPVYKLFTVAGIFSGDSGMFNNDSNIYIHMDDARRVFKDTDSYEGYKAKLEDVYEAPLLAETLRTKYWEDFSVADWSQEYGSYLKAVKIEKTTMFLILLMLIAIAVFNLITSLVMLVNEKKSDIAILRTIGALPRTIIGIFVIQGFSIGLIGTLLGLCLGITLSTNITEFVNFIQNITHMEIFVSSVYFADYLPSKILSSDLVKVCSISLLMSLIATLYPAWHAAKIHPVEILRYD